MILFPAIDLKDGHVVRLTQGRADQETRYFDDPLIPARRWIEAGASWLHVVDLDGAFSGSGRNLDAVSRIASLGIRVQMGGGIRSREDLLRVLSAGIERAVIGTRAALDREFVVQVLEEFGPERIVAGIDAKDGKVSVRGWVETLDTTVQELALTLQSLGVRMFVYTDISRDGMLQGPNFEAQTELLRLLDAASVIASGGVSSVDDLRRFASLSKDYPNLEGVIVGKALYDGRIDIAEAMGPWDRQGDHS